MIKLQYANLRDPHFKSAMSKLSNYANFSTKTCIALAKMKKCIDAEADIAQEAYMKMIKKFAALDDQGNFLPKDNEPGTYYIPDEREEDWIKANSEFVKCEFSVDRRPLVFEDIKHAGLTPNELLAIEPLLDSLDESAAIEAVA